MRITNSTILRGYNRNLNKILNAKTSSEHKIQSGRKFDRASESPLSAAKALNVRQSLYESQQYSENLKAANIFYTEAETSLLKVSDELAAIRETLVAACNSTKEKAVDLNIYAQQLETKASELCSIFNTDSAGRVIFGGECNDAMPFSIERGADGRPSTVLYHGVPLNAISDPKSFPYSEDVYVDIGVGMVINDESRAVDPQSALRVSFNGASITGCGADNGSADIGLSSIKTNHTYTLDIYAGDVKKTITVKGGATQADTVNALQAALTDAYKYESPELKAIKVSPDGVISVEGKVVSAVNNHNAEEQVTIDNATGYTDRFSVALESMTDGNVYSLCVTLNGKKKEINITAGADANANRAALQAALDTAFGAGVTYVNEKGRISTESGTVKLSSPEIGENSAAISREQNFSNNYIQLTLDAARSLRNGDIKYANACIDRIVSASENLLVEIADMGCNEEYIDFNISRIDTRMLNLKERQKNLEATDLESEITLMKTYEALYNATLQMSSTVVPNSIFNYIK